MRVRRGFTILEAVVALTVVGLTAVAALATVGGELRAAARAERAVEASALLQDRLAATRLGVRRAPLGLPDSLAAGRFPAPFEAFRWEASVRPVAGEDERLVELAVTVRSNDAERSATTRVYLAPGIGR